MRPVILGFGLLIFAILVLFQLARFNHFRGGLKMESWIALFSILFFSIGILLSRKFFAPKVIEKKVFIRNNGDFRANHDEVEKLGLSKREVEILGLINDGLSNQQIADKIFLSESTVKKHISNIFLKLDVQRRTEAIKKGKDLGILP